MWLVSPQNGNARPFQDPYLGIQVSNFRQKLPENQAASLRLTIYLCSPDASTVITSLLIPAQLTHDFHVAVTITVAAAEVILRHQTAVGVTSTYPVGEWQKGGRKHGLLPVLFLSLTITHTTKDRR